MKKWILALATVVSVGLLAACSSQGPNVVSPDGALRTAQSQTAEQATVRSASQQAGHHQGSSHGTASSQPYAGLQDRAIKAMAPERVNDLLEGKGAQYALAAELNHYPGPSHILEYAAQLQLSADQELRVRMLYDIHKVEAKKLGRKLVDLENRLDKAFSSGQITDAELERLLGEIGAVDANLRKVHLITHLKAKAILTEDQVHQYDRLRGYSDQG